MKPVFEFCRSGTYYRGIPKIDEAMTSAGVSESRVARGYRYDFSSSSPCVFERKYRERKALKMRAVLEEYLDRSIGEYNLLNIGGSAGVIDKYLMDCAPRVVGIDIDARAIEQASSICRKANLEFRAADSLDFPFEDGNFEIVISSQIYDILRGPVQMFREIRRVLKTGGVRCFTAGSRLMRNEPHYNLPLLSVLPRPIAHVYVRLAGIAYHYYKKRLIYWGLQNLVDEPSVVDYTRKLISEPDRFHSGYIVHRGSAKSKVAQVVVRGMHWALPGYAWLLQRS